MSLELNRLSFHKAPPISGVSGTGASVHAKKSQPAEKVETPTDSFKSAGDVASNLQTKARSLRKSLAGSKLRAIAGGVLAVGAGITAVAVGGPVAIALGAVAATSAVFSAGSSVKAQGARGELNELTRQNIQLWNQGPDTQIGSRGSGGPLAVFEAQASEAPSRKNLSFDERYGPWAVVTGASSGIGKEFAKQLAAKGINPVLVARDGKKLEQAAKEIRDEYGVEVRTVAADLSKADDVKRIDSETRDLNVGLLVNNAGIWAEGEFLENDIEKEAMVNRVNMDAPLRLSSAFGKRLTARGAGGILNVASGLAHVPTAYQANYSATKAYLNHLTHALAFEMKPAGIDVMVLNPGATKTEGTAGQDLDRMPIKPLLPQEVVSQALNGLGKKFEVIPGFQNKMAFGVGLRMLPQTISTAIVGSTAAKFMEIER